VSLGLGVQGQAVSGRGAKVREAPGVVQRQDSERRLTTQGSSLVGGNARGFEVAPQEVVDACRGTGMST
jgi:hypothetical protein